MINMTTSVSEPPIWKPTDPPSTRTGAGALQPAPPGLAAGDKATTELPAEDESPFFQSRDNESAMRLVHQILRNGFLFDGHHFFKNEGCLFKPLGMSRGSLRRSQSTDGEGGNKDACNLHASKMARIAAGGQRKTGN
jgi:hypothetical protein